MAKLTKSLIKTHKKTLLEGFSDGVLARLLGVSARTIRRWRAIARRSSGKKKREMTTHERLCIDFADLHRRGQANLISRLWNSIGKAAETDWKAARYLLSVLVPEDFSIKGIAVRAVARTAAAAMSSMETSEILSSIERTSLEIVLSALREGDLPTALTLIKSKEIDASAFSPEEFLQGMRALKNSILNGDGAGDGGDGIERQLMSIETERA